MEKKTIHSGAPFVLAGLGVLAYALVFGVGSLISYVLCAAAGAAAFAAGRKLFPARAIEVRRAAQSGDEQVDALIAEAHAQLDEIAAANDAIADPELSEKIADIEETCRRILALLEEQPGMASQLRTFLRYYLPATLKVLGARAKLEQEVASGQAQQIAAQIMEATQTIREAFHAQLEALSEYRFINLESEMDALSDMLRSDGLAPQAQRSEAKEPEDPFAGLFTQGGNG